MAGVFYIMQYSRLTREQLETLHPEFSRFLATQSIDAKKWQEIKEQQPDEAERQLDVFSDLVWEGVLNHAEYLDHRSTDQLFLFHAKKEELELIAIKVNDPSIDLLTNDGMTWLGGHLSEDAVAVFTSSKAYEDRNKDLFDLIRKGANLSKGEWYKAVADLI